MVLTTLIGAGHKIMGLALPFALAGITLNILYPEFFRIGLGHPGMIAGWIMLAAGVPVWLTSVIQILINVPRGKLITTGPFAAVLHPLYTSVSLLVIPGVGLLFDSWAGAAIGAVLYIASRMFSVEEERRLEELFADEYRMYRGRILIPWL